MGSDAGCSIIASASCRKETLLVGCYRPKAVTPKVHDVAVAEKKRHLLIVTNK